MPNESQRILIIGNGASGKTTLSLKLAAILNYPVLHLDSIYWMNGWKKYTLEYFEKNSHDFMKSNCWIIEGTPLQDIRYRISNADTVIFLDINRVICILRLLKRAVKNIFLSFGAGWDGPANGFSIKAMIWIWKFNHSKKQTINSLLKLEENKNIFYIKNNNELNKLIACIKCKNEKPIHSYS